MDDLLEILHFVLLTILGALILSNVIKPRRQNFKRIDTEELQGEGSYVVITRITYGEAKKSIPIEGQDDTAKKLEVTDDMLREHIIEWNWVDDEGIAFPTPRKDPTVIERLTSDEVKFLGTAIAGSAEARKNSEPTS